MMMPAMRAGGFEMKRTEILNQIEQLMEQLADLDIDDKEEKMSQPTLDL